ncbi:MAG: dehydrogenase/oxidoreductase family protein (4Fe-4S ferredoxin) [Dehalococcoidia bacterium]|nr:dehydrogenase/oxidoreductase family protein (4Fe-4S ferredoxin) [Dehalococcoidia bacterium]
MSMKEVEESDYESFDTAGRKTERVAVEKKAEGWGGRDNYPFPDGVAFIEVDEMKCVGCGICEMACSMEHFGVINKDLSRILIRKYLLPLPKAVQVTCVQCPPQERECEKACPVNPPAIYFDKSTLHMVVNEETCLGEKCLLCKRACSADIIKIYSSESIYPFVCDLCDVENNGSRNPQCVNVCPCGALYFKGGGAREGNEIHDIMRKHADEKAELISKRLYPLPKESVGYPGWRYD